MGFMQSMMDKMMPIMTKGMSKEDKMQMMEKMMPKMLEDVSMLELMPRMMIKMMPLFMDELKKMGIEKEEIMPKIMGKVMPTMMKVINKEELAKVKDEMMGKIMKDENLKEHMPKCFTEMMPVMIPGCLDKFLKELPDEKRLEFIEKMTRIFLENASEDERKEILQKLS